MFFGPACWFIVRIFQIGIVNRYCYQGILANYRNIGTKEPMNINTEITASHLGKTEEDVGASLPKFKGIRG